MDFTTSSTTEYYKDRKVVLHIKAALHMSGRLSKSRLMIKKISERLWADPSLYPSYSSSFLTCWKKESFS
jgi:hypothetical protein